MARSKYGNRKVERDGIKFDSVKELHRYGELKLLEQMGEIKELRLQVSFELIPAQYEYKERYSEKNGKRLKDSRKIVERSCSYVADFVYLDKKGRLHVEDTKGMRTPEYVIKRKLMLYIHNIRIKEI